MTWVQIPAGAGFIFILFSITFLYTKTKATQHTTRGETMVQLNKQQHLSATLFLNGTAYVTTQLTFAKDPQEESEAGGAAADMLEDLFDVGRGVIDLPQTAELETLHARLGDKPVRILAARKVKAHTLEDIARNMIGKKVTDIETEHEVTVLGIDGKNLIVQDGPMVAYEQALSNFSYEFDEDDAALGEEQGTKLSLQHFRSKNGVEVELARLPAEGGDLRLGFLASGLSVTPHYNIVLAGHTLSLQPLAKVENETGTSFEEILLTVVASEVGRPYFHRSNRGEDIGACALLFGGGPGGSTDSGGEIVEESGMIGYRLGIKDIPTGESLLELPGKAQVDGYRIVHRVNLNSHRQAYVQTSLTFAAPRNLPAGAVAVHSQNEEGEEEVYDQYEGGGSLASTLSGKEATIALRTPDTLKVKIEQRGEARLERIVGDEGLYALFKSYEVTVSNGGSQDTTVETYLHLGEMQQLWGEEGYVGQKVQRHTSSTAHKVRWDITAPAQGEEKHTYTVREKLLRPLNREELQNFAKRQGIAPPAEEEESADPDAGDDTDHSDDAEWGG